MQNQYSRTQLLLGAEAMEKLHNSRVAVFGIGGVGGYTVEALARSGVGALDLIDDDKVCLTNLNRQIIATRSTVGQYKVDVAAQRIHDIDPDIRVTTHRCFFGPETQDQFDFTQYDYVVDAIAVGFALDFVLRGVLPKSLRGGYTGHADEVDCHEEHSDEAGNAQPIWKAALRHTLEIFVFIFAFSLVFGLIVEGVGEDVFASVLGSMGFFQPVVAALVGLIPNCAASVLLTQLYVEGALRFSSLVAGLCTGAGVGLAVLWRTNPSWKQNLFITGLTWGAGAFLGVAMQVVVAVFA